MLRKGTVRRGELRDNPLNLGRLRQGQVVLPSCTTPARSFVAISLLEQLAPWAETPPVLSVVPIPVRAAEFRDLQKAARREFLNVATPLTRHSDEP